MDALPHRQEQNSVLYCCIECSTQYIRVPLRGTTWRTAKQLVPAGPTARLLIHLFRSVRTAVSVERQR